MKKLFIMAIAAVAFGFTSCGNKNAQQAENAEQVEKSVNIEDATAELAAQLEAGDVNKFQEALEAAKTKAAELLHESGIESHCMTLWEYWHRATGTGNHARNA